MSFIVDYLFISVGASEWKIRTKLPLINLNAEYNYRLLWLLTKLSDPKIFEVRCWVRLASPCIEIKNLYGCSHSSMQSLYRNIKKIIVSKSLTILYLFAVLVLRTLLTVIFCFLISQYFSQNLVYKYIYPYILCVYIYIYIYIYVYIHTKYIHTWIFISIMIMIKIWVFIGEKSFKRVKKRKLNFSHFLWQKGILKSSFEFVNLNILYLNVIALFLLFEIVTVFSLILFAAS